MTSFQKISIAINAILLICIGVLFYLYSGLKGTSNTSSAAIIDTINVETPPLPPGNGKVMYINLDTLETKYDYFIKIKNQMEQKGKANQNEIKMMYDGYQRTVGKYQQEYQNGTMDEQKFQAAQLDIAEQERKLAEREEQLTEAYAKEMEKLQDMYQKKVKDFLRRKSQDHNYSYVLGYRNVSNILYADDSLDVTKVVIEGLNTEYKVTK